MFHDIDKDLLGLVTEAAEESVAESALAATATTLLAGAAGAGLLAHTVNNFAKRWMTPGEGDKVTHVDTGAEGVVKFKHHNDRLNIDWQDGSNSSHDKHEVQAT